MSDEPKEPKIKLSELKNHIVVTEVDRNSDYIVLINPMTIKDEDVDAILQFLADKGCEAIAVFTDNVEKTMRFVKIPEKLKSKITNT